MAAAVCWLTPSVFLPQDHHDSPIGLASTIAHEMGHNFGLSHDGPGCVCRPSHGNEDCVMADKLRSLRSVSLGAFCFCPPLSS